MTLEDIRASLSVISAEKAKLNEFVVANRPRLIELAQKYVVGMKDIDKCLYSYPPHITHISIYISRGSIIYEWYDYNLYERSNRESFSFPIEFIFDEQLMDAYLKKERDRYEETEKSVKIRKIKEKEYEVEKAAQELERMRKNLVESQVPNER